MEELADIARSHGIPSVELRAPLPEGPSVRSETVFVRHAMALGPESVTGWSGLSTGDVVNDLTAWVGDPNVSIHEGKAFVCNVEKA